MGSLGIPLHTWNTTSRWVKHTRTSTRSTNTIWTTSKPEYVTMRQKVEQNSLCTWQWILNSYHHPSSNACIHSQETSFGSGWGHKIYRWRRVGGAERREDRVCEVCGVVGDEVHYLYNCTQVQRDDLNVLGDICGIWEQPDIFKLIGRIKSLDILWIHFSWFTNYLLCFCLQVSLPHAFLFCDFIFSMNFSRGYLHKGNYV